MANTDIPSTTVSIPLDGLKLDDLVRIQQGLGAQIDKLRADRAYIAGKIQQRLDMGERNAAPTAEA